MLGAVSFAMERGMSKRPKRVIPAAQAVRLFEVDLEFWKRNATKSFERWIAPLRGKDIVDWCDLDAACHGDVLLRMANDE